MVGSTKCVTLIWETTVCLSFLSNPNLNQEVIVTHRVSYPETNIFHALTQLTRN